MYVHGLTILGNTHNTTQHNMTQEKKKRKKEKREKYSDSSCTWLAENNPILRGLTGLKENVDYLI